MSLLILLSLSVILLLWLWLKGAFELLAEVSATCAERLWPRKWLLLSFVPIVGRFMLKKVIDATTKNTFLKLSSIKTAKFDSGFSLDAAKWVLMEEQYDLKTSDHHGTRLHSLSEKEGYKIVTLADMIRDFRKNEIAISAPRPIRQKRELARLEYDDLSSKWRLSKLGCDVIPIIDSGERRTIRYCQSHSELLENGDTFFVNSSDFNLVHLPSLAIHWRYRGKNHFMELGKENVYCGSLSDNTIIFRHSFVVGHHWELCEDQLICNAKVQYTSLGKEKPVLLECGNSIRVSPGDVFSIPRLAVIFAIDYV